MSSWARICHPKKVLTTGKSFQGMEDVVVLDEMMQKYPGDRLRAFEQYSKNRNPDAEAMCDLAMYNYVEVGELISWFSFLRQVLSRR